MSDPNFWRYLTDPDVAAPARAFARTAVRPVADHLDAADLYPVDLVARTAERGWNALTLPTRYGGGGAHMEHALAVFEAIGAGSAGLAVSAAVPGVRPGHRRHRLVLVWATYMQKYLVNTSGISNPRSSGT